ncbi:PhnE/PtxC family ABC transporter permease [Desulfurivibrio alkaliphilus]|uniref:Binding-protein-dependent transport systems inner membrane component n=1 Tax=Desulfurivibrio alkaliphilus (strain DSM 19089 / UNIQEM U267 / AHT2) TaxID=589865 RepID=D6Z143_DESAT|nr:ABC transporter permease subunit [Desulfurivibrio alkaliphilus]ADH87303.1 binding-protein-dependent transport systems inner membrane component [Desulfurivibrio alkaliphilus AHT 2]
MSADQLADNTSGSPRTAAGDKFPNPSPLPEKRPWGPWAAIFTIAVLLVAAFTSAEWDFTALTDPDQRRLALGRMGAWLAAFAAPDFSAEFLRHCWALTLQTLSAAVIGTGLAVVAAILLAMGSARAVSVGEEELTGWHRLFPLRSPTALLCSLCRIIQDILRAVPDFVWAVILVAVIGLGPMTGALALALNITGILAKVYSELWDSVDERRYEQVRVAGGGRLAVLFYGIGPLAARSVQSFTLMRAECAIRNAAVIGAVGGGGLGADIWYQIQFGAWDKVTTLLLFTLALTLSADLLSNFIRRQLRSDPNHPRAARHQSVAWQLARSYIGVGAALAVAVWSFWFMGWGDNAPPGQQARNFLLPALELLSGEAWQHIAFFERMLRPDLEPAFVLTVIQSASVPLAMALVGTLLGVLAAAMLSYPHSFSFMWESHQFTGEAAPWWLKLPRRLQMVLARLTGLISRGVPEVMWAFLFIAFFGPGLLAGTVAIAIHSAGVLVRVFSESIDNIPYRRFEQSFSGSRPTCFGLVAVPTAWRDWLTYAFFQFESNVRTAVVLGIVGAGGLGFQFSFNFEWFRFEKAATYLLMIIALTVIIDRTSRLLRFSRV